MKILDTIKTRFLPALNSFDTDTNKLLYMIRPAQDAKFGDYQANCAMPLQKVTGKPPREIAQSIVDQVDLKDICNSIEIAGPGFINLSLSNKWITEQLTAAFSDEHLGVAAPEKSLTVVIDYSSPNVAKPMHVGHIRSTVIGDALARTYRFLGHQVISDNHLGDWGTQFGMIIYGYKHFVDKAAYKQDAIGELSRLYKLVRQLIDYQDIANKLPSTESELVTVKNRLEELSAKDEPSDKSELKKHKKDLKSLKAKIESLSGEITSMCGKRDAVKADGDLLAKAEKHHGIGQAVLQETAKLHEGDDENLALWNEFLPVCREDIQRIYSRLDVKFDHEYGESFYHDELGQVVESLKEKQLATESEGAMCVFLDEFESPMIVQKNDGAFLYATTDLATIQYRAENWDPDLVLYVVDHRQHEHFAKLFTVAAKWGYDDINFQHVQFGTVMGNDNKPFKTRAGDTVGLEGLLDDAISHAYKVVCEIDDKKPGDNRMSDPERQQVAQVIGISALKYGDLSQNRVTDYVFSFEKMVALDGNTATYMQYSYARVQSIITRSEVDAMALKQSPVSFIFEHELERSLAVKLLQFQDALEDVIVDNRPNLLTNYLYELAKLTSQFCENCPVIKAESDELKHSRIQFCDMIARTIKTGLGLLGIAVVERM